MRIKESLYWVGVLNPSLRCFDFIPTRFGTTYNSYLITAERPALVDGVLRKFSDLHLRKIRDIIPTEKLEYLVVNHTEPDHSSGVGAILDAAPQITVVGTATAIDFLKQILNRDFRSRAVDDGETLDLGNRHTRFIRAPFWHWPDTMFTYLVEDRVLLPCDGFGSHFCDERMFDDQVGKFEEEFYDYYNHIMRAFAPKIIDGLNCLKGLPIDVIGPSHGPILRTNPQSYIERYRQWATPVEDPRRRVVVFFASIYGNTRKIALAVAEGVGEAADVEMLDAFELDPERARDAIERAHGIVFGSVTLNGDAAPAIWNLLTLLKTIDLRGKKSAAFGSYGWSGEALSLIQDRLKGLRIPVVESDLRFRFTPTADDLARSRAFGREFATKLAEAHNPPQSPGK